MSNNGYAGREAFAGKLVRRYADKSIPGLGRFRIQSLSELEYSTYQAGHLNEEGGASDLHSLKADLISVCVVDADGKKVFRDNDTDMINDNDSAFVNQLFDACQDHVEGARKPAGDGAKN